MWFSHEFSQLPQMESLLAGYIAFQLRFLSKLMEPGVHSFYHTTYRKATTFLSVYHENKGLCKKNTCNVWKLVWLLTVCTSYPPVIMSLTVTVCQWTGGSNLLPLVPSIPCYHPFYWIPPLSYFCCVMSFIHFPPPYNAHSHSFLSHPSHPLLSLAPMPLSTSTV